MRRWLGLAALTVAIAVAVTGCGGDAPPTGDVSDAPASVSWNRDPLAVVFRAHVTGGNPPAYVRDNTIPECTLYGDGRVVFLRSNPRTGDYEILFDRVDDRTIEAFVYDLIVQFRLYTYDSGLARQAPTAEQPVYEQIILNVNDTNHVTDFFADWPGSYFSDVVERCRKLAAAPRLFRPVGVWVAAYQVPLDLMRPYQIWDPSAGGFSLEGLALEGGKRWVEGGLAEYFWNQVIVSPIPSWFIEGSLSFALSVQAPGITLDAPAAPAQ
ncbi:MAG: hypothetical protein SNJ54_16340 [Anaerolineae bacterium]